MRRVGNTIKILAVILFTSVAVLLVLSQNALAVSSSQDVQLTIPSTQVVIQGLAAPNSLVTVRSGNAALGSVAATSSGSFSLMLTQPSGLRSYSVSYEDSLSRQSSVSTRTVSVQPQQTNIFNFFLSPTIERVSPSPLQIGSVVQIRGFTIPNAELKIFVDNGVRIYDAKADSEGVYELLIPTEDLGVGAFMINAEALTAFDTSLRSISVFVGIEPAQSGPSAPDIVVRPDLLPPPVFTSPDDDSIIDGDKVVIRGESVPNAQIVVYENGVVIGSVVADENGNWEFSYTASYSPVYLTFEACVDGRCSVLSKMLTINFTLKSVPCELDFRLSAYRFWALKERDIVALKFVSPLPSESLIFIDWGDGAVEKFNYNDNVEDYSYRYSSVGLYSGSVRLEASGCEVIRYFSVHVTEKTIKSNSYLIVFIVPLLLIGILNYQRQKIIQKRKDV